MVSITTLRSPHANTEYSCFHEAREMHKKVMQLQPPCLRSVGFQLHTLLCRTRFASLRLVAHLNRIHTQLYRFDLLSRSQALQTCVPRERGMQVGLNGIHGCR